MSKRNNILVVVVAAGLLLALAAGAAAQVAVGDNETAGQIISNPGNGKAGPSGLPGIADFLRMILWLGVLILLIYVVVWALRKYMPSMRGSFAGGALKVVSRAHVSARQSVVLVKLGGRFVLVGVSPSGMTRLTEITDPDEANALTEEISQSGAGSFGRALGKAGEDLSATDADAKDDDVREVKQELDAVRRKVNWWRGQTKS